MLEDRPHGLDARALRTPQAAARRPALRVAARARASRTAALLTLVLLAAGCGGGGGGGPGPTPPDDNPPLGGALPFGRAITLASGTAIASDPAAAIGVDGVATVAWAQTGLPIPGGVIPRTVPDVGARESTSGDTFTSATAIGPTASADATDDSIVGLALVAGQGGLGARAAWARLKTNPSLADRIAGARREGVGWSGLQVAAAPAGRRLDALAFAGNGSGTEAFAWVEQGGAGISQVQVIVTSGGVVPALPFAVQGNALAAGSEPAVAVDALGNVMVMWREGPANAGVVRSRLFDVQAGIWQPVTSADVALRPDAGAPRLVAIGNAQFAATWLETDGGGISRSLRARVWNGLAWAGTSAPLIDNNVATVDQVQMTALGASAALAVWRQAGRLQWSRWNGAFWSTPAEVPAGAANSTPRGARVGSDAAGNAVLAWLESLPGGVNDLFVARLAATATTISAPVSARRGSGSAAQPTLSVAPNGSAALAWLQSVDGQAQPDLVVRLLRR